MAALVTTSAGPAAQIRQHFEAQFMERLERDGLVMDLLEQRVIPANSGHTVQFHRIQALPFQTTAITQSMGSAHAAIYTTGGQLKGDAYVVDSVPAALELIGNDLQLSELVILTAEPNPVPELADVFMYNGVGTIEQKCVNLMVCSSTNGASNTATAPSISYNGSSVSTGTVWGDGSATLTEVTLDADIPTHRLAAESFNVATFNLRANSVPVKRQFGLYAALISPGQAADLRMDGTFQEIALKGTMRGENKFERALVGDLFGCRVMESPYISTRFPGTIDATNDEIHRGIVFGQGYAYKVSHKTGVGRPKFTFLPPSVSSGDAYGNIGFLVWKAYFAGTVVNPIAGRLLKTATTNLGSQTGGEQAEWE